MYTKKAGNASRWLGRRIGTAGARKEKRPPTDVPTKASVGDPVQEAFPRGKAENIF